MKRFEKNLFWLWSMFGPSLAAAFAVWCVWDAQAKFPKFFAAQERPFNYVVSRHPIDPSHPVAVGCEELQPSESRPVTAEREPFETYDHDAEPERTQVALFVGYDSNGRGRYRPIPWTSQRAGDTVALFEIGERGRVRNAQMAHVETVDVWKTPDGRLCLSVAYQARHDVFVDWAGASIIPPK